MKLKQKVRARVVLVKNITQETCDHSSPTPLSWSESQLNYHKPTPLIFNTK
jgi:hypothetical protein